MKLRQLTLVVAFGLVCFIMLAMIHSRQRDQLEKIAHGMAR